MSSGDTKGVEGFHLITAKGFDGVDALAAMVHVHLKHSGYSMSIPDDVGWSMVVMGVFTSSDVLTIFDLVTEVCACETGVLTEVSK